VALGGPGVALVPPAELVDDMFGAGVRLVRAEAAVDAGEAHAQARIVSLEQLVELVPDVRLRGGTPELAIVDQPGGAPGVSGILCAGPVSLFALEAFTEDEGKLGSGPEPFARWPSPLVACVVENKIHEFHRCVIIREVTACSNSSAQF